jgi:photosynthetic reaction center cytochrome c subunit
MHLRRLAFTLFVATLVLGAYAWSQRRGDAARSAGPFVGVALADTAAAPPPVPPRGGFTPAATDSFAAERDSLMNEVLAKIRGREEAPAESVFKNIKVWKGFQAARLLRAMNLGLGRSLGVSCLFCHVQDKYADDDKKEKRIARDMMVMSNAINTDLVPKMTSLQGERVTINCGTCHQGHRKPLGVGGPRGPEGRGAPPGR